MFLKSFGQICVDNEVFYYGKKGIYYGKGRNWFFFLIFVMI